MFRNTLAYLVLPLLLLFGGGPNNSVAQSPNKPAEETVTQEKLIVGSGVVTMDVDLARHAETWRFLIAPDSFFTILVSDNNLRGAEAGAQMALTPQSSPALSGALKASFNQLVVEKIASTEAFDLVVRNGKTGLVLFNIEGHSYDYDASRHVLNINDGRLLVSDEFARQLGGSSRAGSVAGKISITATMYPIEIDKVVNGAVQSAVMPSLRQPAAGSVPGPDVIVGDLPAVTQAGSSGSFVGLGVGTTSCNQGVVDLDWFQLPSNDHPVIPQNLFRMSGGASNTDRFEQIGQSWLKHAFTALTENVCSLGCNGVGGSHLGSGCSDPYSSGLNATQSGLGSRAWVNPFTGAYPRGDSATNPNSHTGHTHTGTSHRVLVAVSDLDTTQNPGATYYAEGQYVNPHEYVWCAGPPTPHPGQCNMYNNVSYRRFNVSGTTSFTFSSVGSTVRMSPALNAWTGATINTIEPVPGTDGRAFIAYKVTNPSAGVWHYEYALYNQNLDRAIQSLSVPLGCGNTVSNLGFHAPPQHPGWPADGTQGNTGFSGTPWASSQTATALTWTSETFAQNQNANAIRWGTLYNFRFDSNTAPAATNATVGFFKTGSPITVAIQGPAANPCNPLTLATAASRINGHDLPLPGTECRSTDVIGAYQLVFTFSNNVVSGNAAVTNGTGSVTGSPVFSTNTMTVNLTGVADVQTITVTLSGVTDSNNQVLANTVVTMTMLFGDVTDNASVNSSDVSEVQFNSGSPVTDLNARDDVNGNGVINSSDVSAVEANSGHGLGIKPGSRR
jgi:hypothetical protein